MKKYVSLLCVSALATLLGGNANAVTLVKTDYVTLPVTVNTVSIGDNGSQLVSTPATFLGFQYLLDGYYIVPNAPSVFNYSINYSPAMGGFAATRIWAGNLNVNTGFSSGAFLANPGNVSTDPAHPITAQGSFSMITGTTYMILAGLYDSGNPSHPNGTYTLTWSVSSAPIFQEVLSVGPTAVTPTPLPAALPLFATGVGALGFAAWGRKRRAAASSAHVAPIVGVPSCSGART